MIKVLYTCLLVGGLTVAGVSSAAPATEEIVGGSAPAANIAKWKQSKFGMFIHWGPVSLKGTEIGWSRAGERRGMSGTGKVPVDEYDNLYKQFNPVHFNAKEWVDIAKATGMRYLVFTTRHHDGFSNFDTNYSDYKITSPDSPYRKDIVRQLADACHANGLMWGVYYSQPDWHNPDYLSDSHSRYLKYMHGQVRELLTNYGKTDIIWFDGLQAADRSPETWDAEKLFKMIRTLQPQILINNRCGLPGDFGTPEQEIGKMETTRPWETCMTIGEQWSWKPNDKLKSAHECIQTLVKVVGGDGNLLLNVGPMPDGRIEPRQVAILKEVGQWLEKNGESIYGTRGGPFPRTERVATTSKDNQIFVHVLSLTVNAVKLPPINRKIVDCRVLNGGKATIEKTDDGLLISAAANDRNDVDTIIVLTLGEPAVGG